MQEVAAAGEQHRYSKLVTGLNRIRIPLTAAGMDHCSDAMAGGQSNGVIEREETVTCQNGTARLIARSFEGNAR